MPDLFTLAPTAAPSLLLRTIESFTINAVLEFVATGVTSHADFDDGRFEAAFAESIDVAPSLVRPYWRSVYFSGCPHFFKPMRSHHGNLIESNEMQQNGFGWPFGHIVWQCWRHFQSVLLSLCQN